MTGDSDDEDAPTAQENDRTRGAWRRRGAGPGRRSLAAAAQSGAARPGRGLGRARGAGSAVRADRAPPDGVVRSGWIRQDRPARAVLPDAIAAGRLGPWLATMAMEGWSLAPFVPCGLPLALGCRRLWRLGYRSGAWTAGVALGAVTVMVTLPAGLPGPVAIAVCAVGLSLPIWIAWWWLAWRG